MPQINLWFDSENYGYAIDFEDGTLDLFNNAIESYQPTLAEAISSSKLAIER
ncbi:hypothetical protein IFO70_38855 [Phormidium tenue FACHB-886]|nr:hypothetical protein [Phormidium tenue FACHB-886]